MSESLVVDNAFLCTSRDVAVRAAEWHSHSLGGAPISVVEAITLTANLLIIVQFFLQWARDHKRDRKKIADAVREKWEEDQKRIVIMILEEGVDKLGISSGEDTSYAQSILDVIRPEDLASVITTSGEG